MIAAAAAFRRHLCERIRFLLPPPDQRNEDGKKKRGRKSEKDAINEKRGSIARCPQDKFLPGSCVQRKQQQQQHIYLLLFFSLSAFFRIRKCLLYSQEGTVKIKAQRQGNMNMAQRLFQVYQASIFLLKSNAKHFPFNNSEDKDKDNGGRIARKKNMQKSLLATTAAATTAA